ncbi:hypothetical protein ADK38_11190 [Streptomyces varsoviensis]|uniref:Transposase n=1 Tax=Streptomyces varsoviensis TaxID=67373 RepID=A0ABR5J9D7_9ACTN|nr:hypothetical protein ADK38_11190 [Streptomyces varsoviensis]
MGSLSVGVLRAQTLVLHLRNGHPFSQLTAGFGIGSTNSYRYITSAVEILAALDRDFPRRLDDHMEAYVSPET